MAEESVVLEGIFCCFTDFVVLLIFIYIIIFPEQLVIRLNRIHINYYSLSINCWESRL